MTDEVVRKKNPDYETGDIQRKTTHWSGRGDGAWLISNMLKKHNYKEINKKGNDFNLLTL